MKKTILLTMLLMSAIWSCKKENTTTNSNTTPPAPVMRNIKYEVAGFIHNEITYDGKTIQVQGNWDYSFQSAVGNSLNLSAKDMSGTQSVTIKIYQEGQMTKTAQGYGTQSLTDIVK